MWVYCFSEKDEKVGQPQIRLQYLKATSLESHKIDFRRASPNPQTWGS